MAEIDGRLKTIESMIEIISLPSKWTRFTAARDAYRIPVGPTSSKAVRWCILGALSKSSEGPKAQVALDMQIKAAAKGYDGVKNLNDGSDHKFVMAFLEEMRVDYGGEPKRHDGPVAV